MVENLAGHDDGTSCNQYLQPYLDDALECPQARRLSRADRLTVALWCLIERTADELEMPTEQAADEVAMLCGLAREMMVPEFGLVNSGAHSAD